MANGKSVNTDLLEFLGRGERIRTSDFYLPKVALYQAELHPDSAKLQSAQRLAWRSAETSLASRA